MSQEEILDLLIPRVRGEVPGGDTFSQSKQIQLILDRVVFSCLVLSCLVLSCLVLSCLVFSSLFFSSLFFFYHFLCSFTSFLSTSFFFLFSYISIPNSPNQFFLSHHIMLGTSAIRLLTHVILGFPLKSQEINTENSEINRESAYYEHAENVFKLLSDLKM